jgi:uncharacterized membrane protein
MIISQKNVLFAIIYLLMDISWIGLMSTLFYQRKIKDVQETSMVFKWLPAVLAYITLIITMFFICIPLSKYYENKYPSWLVFGIIGFCIYGVYNFTNGSIFIRYDWSFILVDTMWGVLSFSVLGYISKILKI